jgi:hypothetical protein
MAMPDESVADAFDFDTGFPGAIGSNYGQKDCEEQFLVEIDLGQAFKGNDVLIAGQWTAVIPNELPCDEETTLTVFGFDGECWRRFDLVKTTASAEGDVCATMRTHTNSSQDPGLGGTRVPANRFQRLRAAVKATQAGMKVGAVVFGRIL